MTDFKIEDVKKQINKIYPYGDINNEKWIFICPFFKFPFKINLDKSYIKIRIQTDTSVENNTVIYDASNDMTIRLKQTGDFIYPYELLGHKETEFGVVVSEDTIKPENIHKIEFLWHFVDDSGDINSYQSIDAIIRDADVVSITEIFNLIPEIDDLEKFSCVYKVNEGKTFTDIIQYTDTPANTTSVWNAISLSAEAEDPSKCHMIECVEMVGVYPKIEGENND